MKEKLLSDAQTKQKNIPSRMCKIFQTGQGKGRGALRIPVLWPRTGSAGRCCLQPCGELCTCTGALLWPRLLSTGLKPSSAAWAAVSLARLSCSWPGSKGWGLWRWGSGAAGAAGTAEEQQELLCPMLDIRDFRKLHFSLRQAIFSRLLFVFGFFFWLFL